MFDDSIHVLVTEFSKTIKNLDCQVKNNRLLLNGKAGSYYQKQKLQERAKRLVALPVDNCVEVE